MDLMLLQGGLGNQLFQWAFSLHVDAKKSQDLNYSTLLLDTKLPRITKREYCLKDLIEKSKLLPKHKTLSKLLISKAKNNLEVIREVPINESNKVKDKLYLGFFQDLAIVDNVREQIFESFKNSLFFQNCLANKGNQFIAVHVRRGDYQFNSKTRDFHGLTGINFFVDSAILLREKTSISTLKLFSDAYNEIGELILKLKQNRFIVEAENNSELSDFQEICQAAAVITSNSSFSWWGAYIANNLRNAPIIYPTPWFRVESRQPKNLFPNHWLGKERTID